MSERLSQTPELLGLEEVTQQRDAFLLAASGLDKLYRATEEEGIIARGSMSLTWSVPGGYHIAASSKADTLYVATTMIHHKEFNSGRLNDEPFGPDNPLVVHEITAFPRTQSPIKYELQSQSDGLTHQAFTVPGDKINEFNLVPRLDSDYE